MTLKDITGFFSNRSQPKKEGGSWFYPLNFSVDVFGEINYLESFFCLPELNAIINLKARSFSNGIIKVVNDKLEEQTKDPVNLRLKNPNWFQGQKEFMMQTKLFHEIYGNEYMYNLFPFGFKATDKSKALFTLPSNLIDVELDNSQPYFLHSEVPPVKYTFDLNGRKVLLAPDSIIHLNENRVAILKMDQKDILKGESKMKALAGAINNMRMAYESRGVIIKFRGAQGIISPDSKEGTGAPIPLDDDEKKILQAAYRSYGTLKGQNQIVITNTATKFTAMTQNDPKKLGLFDECKEDFNKMLDSYTVPSELFVRDQGATFENQRQARKGFYTETIIPEANEWATGLNSHFFPDGKLKIIVDYSHLPIFQDELKVKAEANEKVINNLSKLLQDKQITQEEYRSELGKIGIGTGKPIPVEFGDANQQEVETRSAQASLRGSVGGVQGILAIQAGVVAGTTTYESALSMLTIIFGFSDEQAKQLLGEPKAIEVTQPSNSNEDEQE